jgi:hypothetical protein
VEGEEESGKGSEGEEDSSVMMWCWMIGSRCECFLSEVGLGKSRANTH